ncbi:MAG: hypothetical protein ACJAYC_003301 [Halieaceae bacterium]|jgi:hypothetical protein
METAVRDIQTFWFGPLDIAEFDRLPHRNVILARASTQQELDYLARHGGF